MSSLLRGFNEVSLTVPPTKATLTVTDSAIRFNKGVAAILDYAPYAKVLINSKTKQIAISPAEKNEDSAVKFSRPAEKQTASITVKDPVLHAALLEYLPLPEAPEGEVSFQTIEGTVYPDDKIVIFNVADAVTGTSKRRGRRKAQ
ncbi:hypothetical protein [Bifidobacterium sp. UBA744]|uniref:hypothetical protein n=1 Tax=Bifidobacterium sp. UBA744 TaxID=1946112 RepID=UPI0025C1D307|nr:hypothetical protein [Bifidobacterium sp. UBA744]